MSREDHRKHDAELQRLRELQKAAASEGFKLRPSDVIGICTTIIMAIIPYLEAKTPMVIVTCLLVLIACLTYLLLRWCNQWHWINKATPSGKRLRLTLIGVGMCVLVAAYGKHVWPKPAQINFSSYAITGPYIAGTVIGGIPWQDIYTDVRLDILNTGDVDIERCDFAISTNAIIHEIGQATSFPGVTFLGAKPYVGPPGFLSTADGKVVDLGSSKWRGDNSRIIVDRIVKRSTLRIVMATMGRQPTPTGFIDVKKKPEWIRVVGEYEKQGRRFQLDSTVRVG